MHDAVQQVQDDDSGATAVEYALMIALIAIIIFGAVTLLGGSVNDLFRDEQLSTALTK